MRLIAMIISLSCCFSSVVTGATKDDVVNRGHLRCGVSTGVPGFSNLDADDNWSGFDVDFCRAVAAATLGKSNSVEYVALKPRERFTALQTGEVDLLASTTTWTFTRDSSLALNFAGISYYDGQGFLVAKDSSLTDTMEFNDSAICVQAGTTSERNLADFFAAAQMVYKPVVFDTPEQALRGFESGRCSVLTGDQSQLYGQRIQLAQPEDAMILPEVISKEPMGPVVRQGDDAWFNIVKWTLFAMINGEELGVSSDNVDEMKESGTYKVRSFLGLEGIKGEGLGLRDDWSFQVIKQVGNYGEVFDRSIGKSSPLKIDRGVNRLWINGGLHYAPPIR